MVYVLQTPLVERSWHFSHHYFYPLLTLFSPSGSKRASYGEIIGWWVYWLVFSWLAYPSIVRDAFAVFSDDVIGTSGLNRQGVK